MNKDKRHDMSRREFLRRIGFGAGSVMAYMAAKLRANTILAILLPPSPSARPHSWPPHSLGLCSRILRSPPLYMSNVSRGY